MEQSLMETGNAFISLVRQMRLAQKKYFNERIKTNLSRAKKLESDVDVYLAAYDERDRKQNGSNE